jgi:hypothetical protein
VGEVMKTAYKIQILVTLLAVALFVWFWWERNYGAVEGYQIVHAVYLTNQDALVDNGAVCYTREQLLRAVTSPGVLDQAGMNAFKLHEQGLIACMMSNCTVKEVDVGTGDIGFIILKKSQTNGVSFTVIKGPSRFLLFNHSEAQQK